LAKVTGGKRFEDALRNIASRLNKGALQVGFMENATYPDGTKVAMVAAIQEFGAPRAGIPPRPFFRNMIAAKSGEWPEAIAKQLKKTKYDVELTLERVGMGIAGQLQQSIRDTNAPPLKPATIRRKGHAKPLIETGLMLRSATYRVKKS
jgi:hypothetical protein